MEKKLYRSVKDKKLTGVCGGVADYFRIDSSIVRIIWAVSALFAGVSVLAYIICAFVLPEEPAQLNDQYNTVE